MNRRHKNTTIASQFGITEEALAQIEATVRSNLDESALRIADTTAWGNPPWNSPQLTVREIRDGGRVIHIDVLEADDVNGTQQESLRPCNLARAIGSSLLNKFVRAAVTYALTLTKTALEHTGSRQRINCDAIINRAIEFCSRLADWENSRRWFIGPFKAAGFDERDIKPSTQEAFVEALSLWSTGDWEISHTATGVSQWLKTPSVSLREVLLEKIMHIVRLAPEETVRKRRPVELTDSEVPIPKQWDELLRKGSISQGYAAQLLRCDKKTVRRLADRHELKRSDTARIVCDEQLRHQIRKVHGQHVLR